VQQPSQINIFIKLTFNIK